MFIETIMGSPTKIKVLRVLLETKIAYSLADIETLTGLSIGAVHKVALGIAKEGIATVKKGKGKLRYYQVNMENRYANILSAMFEYEKAGRRNLPVHIWNVLETLCSHLKNEFKSINDIVLYGSMARGEFRINSDIDLLVVTENDFEDEAEVRKVCNRKKIKNEIRPVFVTQKELALGREKDADFYENVYKEGMRLI
ncbi:MAG TPA: nucleotidyltransferase domain-containing protein [Candidatus Nanoarchaeia archaeon]|nr:nucleotidyltransferase domain-containing protein [Candidatus Nanoarchaeia archaeon]